MASALDGFGREILFSSAFRDIYAALYFLYRLTSAAHHSIFQRIVNLCGRVIGKTPGSRARTSQPDYPPFMIDFGLIPAFSLTAIKCRQSDLRQRAISWLCQYSYQEGMWEPTLVAQFLREISWLQKSQPDRL